MGSCEISDPQVLLLFQPTTHPLVFLSLPSSVIMFSIHLLVISCFTLMVGFLVGLVVTYPDSLVPVLSLIPSSSPTCHIFVSVHHFLCLLLLLWRCVDFCLSLVFIFLCFYLFIYLNKTKKNIDFFKSKTNLSCLRLSNVFKYDSTGPGLASILKVMHVLMHL